MGTTKLTRKEIIGQDPVHDALVNAVELIRARGRYIALGAGALIVVGLGIYFALGYLERKDNEAQQILSLGIEFYHARVDASALDDPYAKGRDPVFRNEEAQYQAAGKEFAKVISRFGSSKLAIVARYYQGLCQMRLGQKEEALKSLESVGNNTKDRSMGYLAKRVIAKLYLEKGNNKGAQQLLEGIIADPQCEIPKEELKLQLARTLLAMGKKEDAIKTLKEARDGAARSSFQSQIVQELNRLGESREMALPDLKAVTVRP